MSSSTKTPATETAIPAKRVIVQNASGQKSNHYRVANHIVGQDGIEVFQSIGPRHKSLKDAIAFLRDDTPQVSADTEKALQAALA